MPTYKLIYPRGNMSSVKLADSPDDATDYIWQCFISGVLILNISVTARWQTKHSDATLLFLIAKKRAARGYGVQSSIERD